MDSKVVTQSVCNWTTQIGNLGVHLLWYFLHFIVHSWHFTLGVATAFESYLISSGIMRQYNSLDIDKLRYLAIVVESEEAHDISKINELVRWLARIGIKNVCLYDAEGALKKSKEVILENIDNATLFQEANENYLLHDQKHMTLEFASLSDGREGVVKAANLLFLKYWKSASSSEDHSQQIITEPKMTEALHAVGCGGPDPDLLLVYGPARCHLGFPAWRMRYTEIVHMGPLKSMKYGSLLKTICKFTMVKQNYGT